MTEDEKLAAFISQFPPALLLGPVDRKIGFSLSWNKTEKKLVFAILDDTGKPAASYLHPVQSLPECRKLLLAVSPMLSAVMAGIVADLATDSEI